MDMRSLTFVVIILSLLLAACGSTPSPVAEPSPQILPTNTTIPTSTIVPSPTPDPLIFKDDFNDMLDSSWEWGKENKKLWNLTNHPGWLEITVGSGSVFSKNLLQRPIPEVDFELETRIIFEPVKNYQIAGLIIFYNANNYILFGRAYAAHLVGDGFYMDYVKSGKFTGGNFATAAPGTDTIYLRLSRRGNLYDSYYSEDGIHWEKVGQHTSDMQAKYVGLAAGQSTKDTVPAQFDYFIINEIY